MAKHEQDVEAQAPKSTPATVEAGPDPVIEASEKAIADLDIKQPDVKDTTARVQEPIVEKDKDA